MRWCVRLYFLTSSIDASWIPHRRSPATIQDQRMRYWNLLQKAGLPENLFVNLNISHENEFTQASFKFPSVKSKNIYYLWLSFGEQVFTVTRHAATLYNTYKSLSIRKSPQKKASQPASQSLRNPPYSFQMNMWSWERYEQHTTWCQSEEKCNVKIWHVAGWKEYRIMELKAKTRPQRREGTTGDLWK